MNTLSDAAVWGLSESIASFPFIVLIVEDFIHFLLVAFILSW
jgi:hypothetical protein